MKKVFSTIGLILLAVIPVLAHGELSAQINQLTEKIKLDEKNANLYLQRGELYRLNGNAKAALEDYDRTQKLNPNLAEVDLARARLFFDAALPEMTEFSLKRRLLDKHGFIAYSVHNPSRTRVRTRVSLRYYSGLLSSRSTRRWDQRVRRQSCSSSNT